MSRWVLPVVNAAMYTFIGEADCFQSLLQIVIVTTDNGGPIVDCAGIGASNWPLRGNRSRSQRDPNVGILHSKVFSIAWSAWTLGFLRFMVSKMRETDSKRVLMPLAADHVWPWWVLISQNCCHLKFDEWLLSAQLQSGGKCSLWEGGTRGTSLLFAPRDLGFAMGWNRCEIAVNRGTSAFN